MSNCLKTQFHVGTVEDMGCGGVEKLITDACHTSFQSPPAISYATPLVVNGASDSSTLLSPSHGLLGPKTPQDAMQCLHNAPLLADLAEWSQWDLVYAPSLGSLPQFLLLPDATSSSLHALEVCPGTLFI